MVGRLPVIAIGSKTCSVNYSSNVDLLSRAELDGLARGAGGANRSPSISVTGGNFDTSGVIPMGVTVMGNGNAVMRLDNNYTGNLLVNYAVVFPRA